jgi:predicted nucleic acid-binding protein
MSEPTSGSPAAQDNASVGPEVFRLATLCQVRVPPVEAIRTLAQSFQAQSGLSAKDALHLACAVQVGAVCFVTCDDGLIRQAKRLKLPMAILDLVDYVRQVEK